MTQEEKAKAYDEAIEKIKYVMEHGVQPVLNKEDLQSIFPEIFESEDERIEKEIIAFLKENLETGRAEETWSLSGLKRWIAWLEKLGYRQQGKTALEAWRDMRLEVYQQASGNRHEPNYSDDTTKMFSLNDIDEIIEKISEQKSADKIEPKFHEGEWVVNKHGIVHQIANVIENVTYHTYGYDIVGGGYFNDSTEGVRLWTIKDAKEGDVLTNDKSVFIYAKVLYSKPYAYCGVDKFGVFKDNCLNNNWANSVDNIHPATKEQRDVLFAKMKEAGYEWDAEKKELKKIDTLLDLLNKMPSYITVDGIDYHFVIKKTSFYTAYYEAIGEDGSGNAIFWATAFSPIDLLTEMLEILKEKGLL